MPINIDKSDRALKKSCEILLADKEAVERLAKNLARSYSMEAGGIPLASVEEASAMVREMLESAK
jgi:hypothetical protein